MLADYRFAGCIRLSMTTGHPIMLTEITGEPLAHEHQHSEGEVDGVDFLTDIYIEDHEGDPTMDAFL